MASRFEVVSDSIHFVGVTMLTLKLHRASNGRLRLLRSPLFTEQLGSRWGVLMRLIRVFRNPYLDQTAEFSSTMLPCIPASKCFLDVIPALNKLFRIHVLAQMARDYQVTNLIIMFVCLQERKAISQHGLRILNGPAFVLAKLLEGYIDMLMLVRSKNQIGKPDVAMIHGQPFLTAFHHYACVWHCHFIGKTLQSSNEGTNPQE